MTKKNDLHDVFEHSAKLHHVYEDALTAPATQKPRSSDIHSLLAQSDKQNYTHYRDLTESQKKEFSPWVIQRWLANKKLEFVDIVTNPLIHVIPPELAWRLFCVIGIPGSRRYGWNTPPKKLSSAKGGKVLKLIASHYSCSTRVAKTYIPLLSDEQILEIADIEGLEKKELTDLKRALKIGKK